MSISLSSGSYVHTDPFKRVHFGADGLWPEARPDNNGNKICKSVMTQVACIGGALLHQGVLHNVLDPPKQKPARALDLVQNMTVMLNTTIVRTIQDIGIWGDTCDATYCQFHRWFNYMVTNDISLRQNKQVQLKNIFWSNRLF